jgi:hypothetical protein
LKYTILNRIDKGTKRADPEFYLYIVAFVLMKYSAFAGVA